MAKDYLRDVLDSHIDNGSDPSYWWDEERIPLASIDQRVSELLDLTGKKAVVTGGAGLNLGQACVNRLAGLGADVAVVDLDPELSADFQRRAGRKPTHDAAGVAAQASEKWGASCFPVFGDVMTWEGARRVIDECHDRLGHIDILVNNAVEMTSSEFHTMSIEDMEKTIRGCLLNPMYCTRAVLDHMMPRRSGRIINIGSTSGMSAMPDQVVYGTAKAAVNTFTKFLGKEAAKYGIRVLGVNPGSMWGPDRDLLPDSAMGLYCKGRIGIQRYELPEEVANMVAFLASDASSCMAGVMVDMGGGQAL